MLVIVLFKPVSSFSQDSVSLETSIAHESSIPVIDVVSEHKITFDTQTNTTKMSRNNFLISLTAKNTSEHGFSFCRTEKVCQNIMPLLDTKSTEAHR